MALFDTLRSSSLVLQLRKSETVFRVLVPLGHDALHCAALFKQTTQLFLELLAFGLNESGVTLPSRLVMKSLLVWLRSSERERSRSRRFGLDELDYDMI